MSDAATVSGPGLSLKITMGPNAGLTDEAIANRALVEKTYRALEAGQDDALIAILDEDILFVEADSLQYGGERRGIQGTLEGVGAMLDAWSQMNVVIHDFITGGDIVIAYMTVSAVSRRTGKPYTGPCAELFRLKDGKIVEWRPIYWDTKAAAEAIGY